MALYLIGDIENQIGRNIRYAMLLYTGLLRWIKSMSYKPIYCIVADPVPDPDKNKFSVHFFRGNMLLKYIHE
jgi:hypothetical protein